MRMHHPLIDILWYCALRLSWLVLAAAGLLLIGREAPAGERTPVSTGPDWNRTVNLTVRGQTLGEVISQLYAQSRVTLQASKDLCGAQQELWKEPVYLQGRGLTVRQAVEWAARTLGCRYRYQGGNAAQGYTVVLDSGYSWIAGGTGMILRSNLELLTGDRFDVADLDRQLSEVFKIANLFDADCFYRLEEHGRNVKLVAALPKELTPLFEQAVGILEQRGQSVPALDPRPAEAAETDLSARLERKVVAAYRQRSLDEVAADLAAQGGVNIGFDQTAFRGTTLPLITLDLGTTTLREAIVGLSKQARLPGIEISLPGGVWLGSRETKWTRMSSREFAWRDTAQARAYYVGDFGGGLEGPVLAHQLRTRILPDAWLDPLVSVTYHPPSGNLLVIGSPALQQEVVYALGRYRKQSQQAVSAPQPALPGPATGSATQSRLPVEAGAKTGTDSTAKTGAAGAPAAATGRGR